ncbi:quinolinate synthase NadA [bacterium]|nr:quinolinate synthase NadA [bacterium]
MSLAPLPVSPLIGNDPVSPELRERLSAARKALGSRVLILGHHYQRDDVIDFADVRGDSLDLAMRASKTSGVEYVIFCGVHFMAETADILTPPDVQVILPDMRAGCSMADMADIDQVEEAWEVLTKATSKRYIPITYINSTAALKAFCGRHGGAVCTSSNARKVVEWAFTQGEKLLFFPDQHLGRNTCHALGIGLDDMLVYDPHNPHERAGGNDPKLYDQKKVVLWRGHCSVHQNFSPSHPDVLRSRYPGVKILVHPECQFEVVQKADLVGSTRFIIDTVKAAPAGTRWAIGTEHHLVNRLAQEHPEQMITTLAPFACQCSTMFRISPEALADRLEELVQGKASNVIRVDDETRRWATIALERMLDMRD